MEHYRELQEELIAVRRDFHRHAESKWQEFRTASRAARYLIDQGIPVLLGEEMFVPGMGFGMPGPEETEKNRKRALEQGELLRAGSWMMWITFSPAMWD